MSKMRTNWKKGRKHRKVALLSLLLAIFMTAAGGLNAMAFGGNWGGIGDWIGGGSSSRASYTLKVNGSTAQDSTVARSRESTVTFSTDKIFEAVNMNSIKAFEISSENVYKGAPLEISLSNTNNDKNWTRIVSSATENTHFVYKSGTAITAATFNSLMSQISVRINPDYTGTSATGKVSIRMYSDTNLRNPVFSSSANKNVSIFSCNFVFYSFATANIDTATTDMDYKTDYAASYDSTYASDVPDGQVNQGIAVQPLNADGGKASFDMYLKKGATVSSGNTVSYGLSAKVGYQIKPRNSNWDTTIEKHWNSEEYRLAKANKNENVELWDESVPIHFDIEGLDAGVIYDIRGIVATDGKTSTPQYTSVISFCYEKPNINSFSTGSTTQVYQGGNTMKLSMLTTFNDENALDKEYTGIDGDTYQGPALKADLYFTTQRDFTTVTDKDGKKTYGEDRSKWYRIPDKTVVKTMEEDGKIANTFQMEWPNNTLPSTVGEVTGNAGDTTPIDSKNCAYKLVVTDLYTGYTAVSYSDCFTIDNSSPTTPSISAVDNQGQNITLDLDDANKTAVTVGGAGAQVLLEISGSEDGEGSGLREYSYAMFYIATDDAVGDTTYDVLKGLDGLVPGDPVPSNVEYTSWTVASDKLDANGKPVPNTAQLGISKDGFYRIVARAVDEAGHQSETVSAFFRVDLSIPAAPAVYLVKQSNPSDSAAAVLADPSNKLVGYDERTYTDSKVWLLAYSEPKTGKSLDSFEFSTDSGLTWTDVKNVAAGSRLLKVENTTDTIGVFAKGSYTEGSEVPQLYQVLIDVSGLGYNDYTSFIVRAKDTLGNVSSASAAVIMRTTPSVITVSATLSHDPIEVAMAQGNSNINPTDATKALKIATARKINEKYYGNDTSVYTAAARAHECTWADDTVTGACTQANCPYTLNPDLFSPEDVNIQGISAGSAGADMTKWKFFTHCTNSALSTTTPSKEGCIQTAKNDYAVGTESYPGQLNTTGITSCMRRTRHIADMSAAKDFSLVQFNGVTHSAITDWLFLHFDQPGNKTIWYTMNTAKCDFHTYVSSGFWFNSTIQQQSGGSNWLISGYLLILRQGGGSWQVKDRNGNARGCALEIYEVKDQVITSLMMSYTAGGTLLTSYGPSTSANSVLNFKITIEADNTSAKGYRAKVYMTEGSGKHNASDFKGLSPIMSAEVGRPTIGGWTIGDTTASGNPYRSMSDCFGIGPVLSCSSHACDVETVVQFSNMNLEAVSVRKLSEVVTEPQWGNGKAKFIMNLSDDAVEDFRDPVLTSQIQWRLNNDKARYIGWGIANNKAETISFLQRMAGQNATEKELRRYGMYETYGSPSNPWETQIDNIAEYLANQYYVEFGYDTEDISGSTSNSVIKELNDAIAKPDGSATAKGAQFSMDDIKNINLTVAPAVYNTTTANPDFPAGRWYMVHDAKGMGDQVDVRSGKYSDALDANVSLPGRYTFYFAPAKEDVTNGTLDPATAVFDFVVNQRPEARFTGEVNNGILQITDLSYDPDCPSGPRYADAYNNTESYIDANGVKQNITYSHTQMSGIVKTEWRWELLQQTTVNNENQLVVNKRSDWSTTPLNGQSLTSLIGSSALPENSVLTVYCRVTDMITRKEAKYDGLGNFAGYEYVSSGQGLTSSVTQLNISNAAGGSRPVTYAPNSVISLSSTTMYDTAGTSTNVKNKYITVTRQSSHSQKGKLFAPSFAIDLGKAYAPNSETNYISLTLSGTSYVGKIGGTTVTVLEQVTAPTYTGKLDNGQNASTGGVWRISHDFINTYVKSGDKMVLQLTETSYGWTAEAAAMNQSAGPITDASARAIHYSVDTNPPSAQVVTANTMLVQNNKTTETEYEASNYLDVTNNDRYIRIRVSGSEDNEGSVAGYRYYFYDKDTRGNETVYYTKDSSGRLTRAGTTLTSSVLGVLSASGGNIDINKNSMRSTPTDSLNVAIFAIDNQTKRTATGKLTPYTITGANETAKTRIEDIKLTVSKPMPPSISATNNMNQSVAYIGNDAGFINYTGDPDTQTTELKNYSGTAVTVQFIPRTEKYALDASGNLVLSSSGTEYYQDAYGKADMTGVANIRYTVRYKRHISDQWWTSADYNDPTKNPLNASGAPTIKETVNEVISSASTISFTEDGYYEISAVVLNGSGSASDERKIAFTIDKTAPTGLLTYFTDETGSEYVEGSWAKSVSVRAYGAQDLNAQDTEYYYSEDNGKTWVSMGSITSPQNHQFSSGEHTVMIKAMDAAGNEMICQSIVVRVDSVPPEVPPATLKVDFSTTEVYTEYVIHVGYEAANGRVFSIQNNVTDDQSTEVSVQTGGDVRFEFYPANGRKLGEISFNGAKLEPTGFDSAKGVYYLNLTNITADSNLSVTFPEADADLTTSRMLRSGVYAMRSFSANSMASAVSVLSDEDAGEDAGEDSGETKVTVTALSEDIMKGAVSVEETEVVPGTQVQLTITPSKGYKVSSILVNGESQPLDDDKLYHKGNGVYSYIVTVQEDSVIWVSFEEVPVRTLRLYSNDEDCGTVTLNEQGNINITNLGGGVYTVPVGEEISIILSAKENYSAKKMAVSVGDTVLHEEDNPDSVYLYTVPAYTGPEDPGIDVWVGFDLLDNVEFVTVPVKIQQYPDGETHGSVSPLGDLKIPLGGSRLITMKPETGYKLENVYLVTETGDGVTRQSVIDNVSIDSVTRVGTYSLASENVMEGDELEIVFARMSYKMESNVIGGGVVRILPQTDESYTINAIPEGIDVKVELVPYEGYKLKSLTVTEAGELRTPGAVSSYTIKSIHGYTTVTAVFEPRVVSHTVTAHRITATANNVKDANDVLADEPYQFQISDGVNTSAWTNWSASNSHAFTGILQSGATGEIPLDPNKEYTVYVRARDRVGNVSDPVASTVYTYPNKPEISALEAVDDQGNTVTKSVSMTVDANGNPSETEYLVYVDTDSAMENATPANNGQWSTLDSEGKLTIKGLIPGTTYYFQLIARNPQDMKTSPNTDDIPYIMLSPAAPAVNTMFFTEQDGPGGGITLRWDAPEENSEIVGYQIYRDGMYLAELKADQLSYTDEGAGEIKRTGDTIYRYSYAFVNKAGAGSSQIAISEEYYNALHDDASAEKDAKQTKMDALLKDHEDLFSETMTYPVYPVGTRSISASASGSENSGRITVAMAYDSTEMGRYQKYKLTLKGFLKNADGTYTEVSIDQWDPEMKHRSLADPDEQEPQVTRVTREGGVTAARATWTNLSTRYEYQIFVQEVLSNGETTSNNIGSQDEGTGIEGFLGKTYYVNEGGYGFYYRNDDDEPALDTVAKSWASQEELDKYTYDGKPWDSPVNNGYIAFNKSASLDLAADPYSGNGDKVRSDENGQYLLIDQSMADKTFHINVAAWDEDGLKDHTVTPYVRGDISGVAGSASLTQGEEMPKTREAAMASPYEVVFDASGLATGVYEDLSLKAYDGDTEATKEVKIRLVVNRNTPSATVEGGVKRYLEKDTPIVQENMVTVDSVITRDPVNAHDTLSRVALVVMPEQYTAIFGTAKYETLKEKLCGSTPDAAAVTKAKELLGSYASNSAYVSGNKLTEAGLKLAILRVAPPVVRYVKITESQYNGMTEADQKAYALKEVGSSNIANYWVELNHALDSGLCNWLSRSGSGMVTPVAEVTGVTKNDTYTMKLVTKFGGNTSSQAVDFIIRNRPSATILTEKRMEWTDTHKDEYQFYLDSEMTVGAVLDRFELCYDPATDYVEAVDRAEKAYRTVGEGTNVKYQVYKLVDKQAQVDQTTVGGTIRADLGIQSKFTKMGVLYIRKDISDSGTPFDPNTTPASDSRWQNGAMLVPVAASVNGTKPIESSGDYYFNVTNLSRDTTYYLWSYYELEDGTMWYSSQYSALTTATEYETAFYGFETVSDTYYEKDINNSTVLYYNVQNLSNEGAYGTVSVSAEYYAADEFGNLLLDADKNPIPITGDQLEAAKETLRFYSGSEKVEMKFKDQWTPSQSFRLSLTNNTKQQGHMVVRLRLQIVSSEEGFCQIFPGREYMDIFVQDDESPVTSYLLGIVNEDENHKPLMKEETTIDGTTTYYYNLKGLQVDYNEMGNLLVTYKNIGTGDLENITADVYTDMNGTEFSPYFEAERPSDTNLLQSVSGAVGTVLVHPVAGLPDGVYDGWLILTADNVEPKDRVRIHIRQVVGQSTLKGRIYITPEMPAMDERTGVATITLYDANTCSTDIMTGEVNMGEPLYTAQTNMYGGEFEITNILNKVEWNGNSVNAKYHVIVERDGFVTYDSYKYNRGRPILVLDGTSKTYTLELRLLGGDLDRDQDIDDDDLKILIDNYNKYPAEHEGLIDYDIVKRCDFNLDGVVNALDRAFLFGNRGLNGYYYPYDVLVADE